MEHSDRVDFTLPVDEPRRVGWIASHYLSYVHDNSLWIPSGPIDGTRFSFTAGISSDFTNSRFDSYLLSGDWRRYFRIGRRSTYAVRALGFYSGGDRPRRINIGGTLGLRGYPQFGYILGSHAFMLIRSYASPCSPTSPWARPSATSTSPRSRAGSSSTWVRPLPDRDDRALLGSYGLSFRLAIAPLAVLRLDLGRRFTDDNYGVQPDGEQKRPGFLSFFFGYNY